MCLEKAFTERIMSFNLDDGCISAVMMSLRDA
jgi:hypothetical protein